MVTEKYNHAFIKKVNISQIQLGDDSTGLRMEVNV